MAASSAATFFGSPRAMLSGTPAGRLRAISRKTRPLTAPSEPAAGSLASTMSAPPATAAPTSAADRTLTNSRIRAPL